MQKVITVVVTYNRKELMEENIRALLKQDYPENRIVIIDNASTDGTAEMLKKYIDNVKVFYFNTGKNRGGSYGFSYGTKKAVELGCDDVWLMDDDCIVHENSLSELVKFADSVNNNFGYLASKVLWKDGTMCKMNIPKKNIASRIDDYEKAQRICLGSFVSCFIKTKAIEDVGLPMKDFFIWGDDWEYTLRLSKKYNCYYVPSSAVTHKSKSNSGVNIATADSKDLTRYQYAYRNEAYLYNHAGIKGIIYHFCKIMLHTARILFKKCDKKMKRLHIVYKYTFKGNHFHPHTDYVFGKDTDINVLEYFGDPISYGGQEIFVENMYRDFQDEHIHYTFGTPFYCNNSEIQTMVENRGDKIVAFNRKDARLTRKKNIVSSLKQILKSDKYEVVHIHSGSVYTLLKCAKAAKKSGVKIVIVHSHLAGQNTWKYRLIKKQSDKKIERYADKYFACSETAAEWKFPKDILENRKYKVIKNGIQTESYRFNATTRKKIRKELGIKPDQLTFVHVGRFAYMKNHAFFYDLLPLIENDYPDFKFIFVGKGELKAEFKKEMMIEGMSQHLIFLEDINCVNEILMAGDNFLFPSLYEGFPITLIEAEASGIQTVFSDKVTDEALITDKIVQLPLNKEEWMNQIRKDVSQINTYDRSKYAEKVKEAGYDAVESAHILEKAYRGE